MVMRIHLAVRQQGERMTARPNRRQVPKPAGGRAGLGVLGTLTAVLVVATPLRPVQAAGPDLSQLSLEQLANLEVTSVTKAPQPLQQAPASIYVITHDDIARSGVTSISEALRLAPNLTITQLTASNYVAAARGLGGNPAAQSFSNKLLILIDGRSVYSPLFSGVYLDAQDTMLEDVDRIEVISGPGASLWGANATNGVINIITRPAYLTDGTLVSVDAGNREQDFAARQGGKIDDETAFRVYGKTFQRAALQEPDRSSAHDNWYRAQGGFRLDRSRVDDTLTLQGDIYRALENDAGRGSEMMSGANLLARWQRRYARSDIQLQAYFDQTETFAPFGGTAFVLHTWDVQLQHGMVLSGGQKLQWGAGERLYSYSIDNTPTFGFAPAGRNLTLSNLFVQDTLALGPSVKLTAGVKLEDDPYAGWQFLPDIRGAWELDTANELWISASRAVRSPTPFDVDVQEKVGTVLYLRGNPGFEPERMRAYEIGYRGAPFNAVSLSASFFYNEYEDLRSLAPGSATSPLPYRWANGIEGHTYGFEAWARWQAMPGWRLSPGVRTVHQDLRFTPGTSSLPGLSQAGDDPTSQILLTSSMDLSRRFTLDATLRRVGALPDPALPAYTDMNARLGWRIRETLQLALSGFNLLHSRHLEFPAPYGEEIPRNVMLQLQWRP
jgi:iron complex outermembrane receptor protein